MVRMAGRVVPLLLLAWLVPLSGVAWAGHDDYGPGSVILHDEADANDWVVMVFPATTDPDAARAEAERSATRSGLVLTEVRVQDNSDPDTVRLSADIRLGERTAFLQRRIPAQRLRAWREVAGDGRLHLQVDDWAGPIEHKPDGSGGYVIGEPRDLDYAISRWALGVPLLALITAVVVPPLVIRSAGTHAERAGGSADEKLHRLRRVSTAVQMIAPLAVVVALLTSGTGGWAGLLLTELAPAARLPSPVTTLLGVLAFVIPVLLAFAVSAAATVPFDRRWRGTEQTVRAGTGQAIRAIVLAMVPTLIWVTLLAFLPRMSSWALVPLVLLFVIAIAALAPLLTNAVLTTRRLAEPRRSQLLDICQRQGVAVRDVRILDSRGGKVANAAISGVLPRLRYVFLTDHLLERLDERELEAVLSHEVGHGKEHHLLIKTGAGLLAVAATVLPLAFLLPAVLDDLPASSAVVIAAVATPLALLTALLLAHGVVGIALERRADDHAVRTTGGAPLLTALEKIAEANRIKRRTGWLWNVLQQHPGLEQRLQRLEPQTPGAHVHAAAASEGKPG